MAERDDVALRLLADYTRLKRSAAESGLLGPELLAASLKAQGVVATWPAWKRGHSEPSAETRPSEEELRYLREYCADDYGPLTRNQADRITLRLLDDYARLRERETKIGVELAGARWERDQAQADLAAARKLVASFQEEKRLRSRTGAASAEVTSEDRARAVEILCMTMDEDREAIARLVAELRVLRAAHAQPPALAEALEWEPCTFDSGRPGYIVFVGPYECWLEGDAFDEDGNELDEPSIDSWRVQWGEAIENNPVSAVCGSCVDRADGDEKCRAAIRKHLSDSRLVP